MSTVYDKTDNYALNLYGDNDPADLRDGYNGSMRTIDTTLETHLNRIESVEARETHDEEVAKALLGDNTVDNATAAKVKWDKAAADSENIGELHTKVEKTSADLSTIKPQVEKNTIKFTGNTSVQIGTSPYYYNFDHLMSLIGNCIKRGVFHIILVVELDNTNSIKYLTVDQYVQAAKYFAENGGTVSAVNFHNVNWSLFDAYKATVNSVMAKLSAYTKNVILFNENAEICSHWELATDFINELKNLYKVGVSFNSSSIKQDKADQLFQLLDLIGINLYIFAGRYGENLTLSSIKRNIQNSGDFNYLVHIIGKYKSKCYINEVGVRPYYNYYNLPDAYSYDSQLLRSPEAITLYLSAVFELLGTKVKNIFLWYDPQDDAENETFFNQLTGIKIGD